MKRLVGRCTCSAPPIDAWYALRGFRWSVSLRDVVAADAAETGEEANPDVGGRPVVLVYDGLDLRCRIIELDHPRRMRLSVRWRRLLHAELTYEVGPAADGSELVHTRAYRGLATRYLASIWRAREEEELAGVLRDWCWEAGSIAAQRRYAV
jgi:hypothetical protein